MLQVVDQMNVRVVLLKTSSLVELQLPGYLYDNVQVPHCIFQTHSTKTHVLAHSSGGILSNVNGDACLGYMLRHHTATETAYKNGGGTAWSMASVVIIRVQTKQHARTNNNQHLK